MDNKDLGKTVLDDIIMIFLSLASVFLLVFEVVADLNLEQKKVIQYTDLIISFIFLAEFITRLLKSANKKTFFKKFWWELLASIPLTNDFARGLRGLRLLRIIRLVRLIRLIRLTIRLKIIFDAYEEYAKKTYLIYIATVVSAIVIAGALGFHYFEIGINPNVHSLWDSIWWAIVTITTIGYGDIFPVTLGGRIVAIFLMISGIGTLGAVTASFASYLIRKDKS